MQIINEKKKNDGAIYFERIYTTDGKIVGKEEIVFPTLSRKRENGFISIIMYDRDMQPLVDAYGYLNQKSETYASRRQAIPALRLLFSYEEIVGKKLKEFTAADIEALKSFLHGTSYGGTNIQLNLSETRSNETVNIYLGIYRKYCDYLGITNNALEQRATKSSYFITGTFAEMNLPYKRNERVMQRREVPMYISVNDFRKILNIIRDKYTIREEAIVRLMYECGLRLGEVFGLTGDDLMVEDVEESGYTCFAYLRNRVSDNPVFQSAKGCMKVKSKNDYKKKDYSLLGYGYQKVIVPRPLYDLVGDYIEEAHIAAREKYGDKYWDNVGADRVCKAGEYDDPNYYVFLNSRGKVLSQQTWNKILRRIFEEAGLIVDTEKKEHNLNHRFRHGFAMQKVKEGCDLLTLQKLMRHNSIDSTQIYFRPTTADAIAVKKLYEDELYNDIPELKECFFAEDTCE